MMFDFTNYTFSGLLSILASIYGIGYPLIIQTIRSIYNQYDSDLLSCRFSKEPVYKVFQILMIVNMVVAILAPAAINSVDVEVILYWKSSSVNLSLITACTNVFYAKSEGVKDFFSAYCLLR